MVEPHKIFYKGKEQDFVVFVENFDLLKKYKSGDTTIPLIDVLSIYKIFTNRQGGSDGILDESSKRELSNEFGTSDSDVIIKKILHEGSDQSTNAIHKGHNAHNDTMGASAHHGPR